MRDKRSWTRAGRKGGLPEDRLGFVPIRYSLFFRVSFKGFRFVEGTTASAEP